MIYILSAENISETNSGFHVKERTTWKVLLLFFETFLLVLSKFLFWQGECALGYHFSKFRDFLNVFYIFYNIFLILDFKLSTIYLLTNSAIIYI